MPDVVATHTAMRQIAALRGDRRRRYNQFEEDLARHGCGALDYRLTGDEPLPSICVRHLRGNDRALVTFAEGKAWVLLVAPHDSDHGDAYGLLYGIADVEPPAGARTKPPCCDDDTDLPTVDVAAVQDLVDRISRFGGRRAR